ncbi:MAG: 2Fe-2S iron-sulfur cluster binding domain-containing protein [Polyangiaceae bacterium]|nr:2Fe-2S iron-sulfur cluster binding domain-containing protein [Polyangiaceae bacterium]
MFEFLFARKKPRVVTLDGLDRRVEAQPKETLLKAALREGVRFPNDCRVGGCGACKCRLLEGKVDELTESAYVLSKEELAQGYVLACQSVPKTDVRIAVDGLALGRPIHERIVAGGRILRRRALTHDIAEIVVKTERKIAYTAGQYARLASPSLGDVERSYSFARACPAGGTDELTFFVREVPSGALSPFLVRGAAIGAEVRVAGPDGSFGLNDSARPILAIAGGSGLAPILALLEDAARTKCSRAVVVLFGARAQRDLYELETLETMRRSWNGSFTVVPVLSQEPDTSGWAGERGLLTDHIERHLDAEAEAYVCGPPPMIDTAIVELERFGLRSNRIFADKFLDLSHLEKRVA